MVRKAFLRLLPVQILSVVVAAVNTFIDGAITGQMLGTGAMAAIGFFGPVCTGIGLFYVFTTGMQVLFGQYLGSGDTHKASSLFSTGMLFLGACGLAVTALLLALPGPLAHLLGAREHTAQLLVQYTRGYAPGIPGQILAAALMMFLPMNNDVRRSYVGIGLMVGLNTGLDVLFVAVFQWGIFGMGLATAVSYLGSAAAMLPGFIGKNKTLRFQRGDLCFGAMLTAAYLGLPGLMFSAGNTFKGYVINQAMRTAIGDAAVAVMNVQGSICSILGAIPVGTAGAFMALASIYYGEEDRRSMTCALRLAFRWGTLLSAGAVALLMASSSLLPGAFFSPGEESWEMTRRMLLLFSWFLILNTWVNVLLRGYQSQGKMGLVNGINLAEQLITALFAVSGVWVLGADGVWLSFPLSQVLCLLVITVSVILFGKRFPTKAEDWLKLSPAFGASEEESLVFSLRSMEEVVGASRTVTDFCLERGFDSRTRMVAGLSVEEMAGNVVTHGFRPGETHTVDVRLVNKNGLIIRIRDDCRAFDPKSRADQFHPEDPLKNVGLRLVARLAREMTYYNNAGINTLLLKL